MLIGVGKYQLSPMASRRLEEIMVESGKLKVAEMPEWLDEHIQYADFLGLMTKTIVDGFVDEEGIQLYEAILIVHAKDDYVNLVEEARRLLKQEVRQIEKLEAETRLRKTTKHNLEIIANNGISTTFLNWN